MASCSRRRRPGCRSPFLRVALRSPRRSSPLGLASLALVLPPLPPRFEPLPLVFFPSPSLACLRSLRLGAGLDFDALGSWAASVLADSPPSENRLDTSLLISPVLGVLAFSGAGALAAGALAAGALAAGAGGRTACTAGCSGVLGASRAVGSSADPMVESVSS